MNGLPFFEMRSEKGPTCPSVINVAASSRVNSRFEISRAI